MGPGRTRTSDWRFMGWHYKAIHRLSGVHNRILRVRARGLEHVPRMGAALLAANHCAYWDGILLQAALPRPANLLVRHELFRSRFGNWFFGRGGAIPVERDAKRNPAAFERALQALRDERLIGVFPEGARAAPPDPAGPPPYRVAGNIALLPPRFGLARLALTTGVPVVPIAVLSDKFWPRTRKWPDLREPIYLHAGEPVTYKGDPADTTRLTQVGDDIMARIAELIDIAHEARTNGEKWPHP